jgi:glycyl-tRNA synthetase beta chain
MSDFLLEIGTEEIPHWMIPGALAQLAKLDLLGATANVDATPRRLVVRATGVPDRTPDQEQIIKGPPISAGDKAAGGFAKKQGVELSAMQKVGDYYELRKHVPGRRAVDILSETLPAAILALQWPKTMYWVGGKAGPRFIRPIRWIVAVLSNETGDQVIPFEIAGVKSGNVTRGHRQLGSSSIPVTISNYESELRKNFVILSSDERRKKIETEAAVRGAKPDADLLETLTFVTEYPTAIRGDFDPSFLALPTEVLTTVLKHHQKTFSIESAPGVLAPHFVAVMNTAADPDGWVKLGNERVIKARFNDARFFFDVDQHRTLADRVEDLKKVTFHAKIGNYFQKVERLEELAPNLALAMPPHVDPGAVATAAHLCKSDLTTELVKEFTDLQGKIGGLYARLQGSSDTVALAIHDHYLPLSMSDKLPRTPEGLILALADKMDTLRESFRVGMVPTGSKDPFALRRAAQGVVRVLAEGKLDFLLTNLCLEDGDLLEFLKDRVRYYLREVKNFPYDEVNAAVAPDYGDLPDLEARLVALHEVRSTEHFEPLAMAFKRMRNIVRQAKFDEIRTIKTSLIEDGPERNLFDAYVHITTERLEAYFATKDYKAALLEIASIRPQVDRFLDPETGVRVRCPNPEVAKNRLTLLSRILTEFSTIADFSEIVTAGDQK